MANSRVKTLEIIAGADVVFFAIAIFGSIFHRTWMAFGIGSIAIVTFVGMFYFQKATMHKIDLRIPIATTVTLVYLLLVITWSFYRAGDELPQMTETLMTSFTSITGIVIAFYFGSSAYVEAHRKRYREDKESSNKSRSQDAQKGTASSQV